MPKAVYVGLDIHKKTIAVAVAEEGQRGEVKSLGIVPNTPEDIGKMLKRIASPGRRIEFCYEAGCCGYGVHRQIVESGHTCYVVAPSKLPRKPGDRIKTDRRDAELLAKALRAGEAEPVWVPDPAHEAIRDLVGCRMAAAMRMKKARQQLQGFLLRHGRGYPGGSWTKSYWRWLGDQKFEHAAQQTVHEEYCSAARDAEEHHARIVEHIHQSVPQWSLAPLVNALAMLRGIDILVATSIVAATGDMRRFDSPRQLMSYFGLVPSEHTSGSKRRLGAITKTGNCEVRRLLIQAAWHYRHPARVGRTKMDRVNAGNKVARDIAWKGQLRLTKRFKHMIHAKKQTNIVVTAIARELLGFIWAIGQEIKPM
jgi:transposase